MDALGINLPGLLVQLFAFLVFIFLFWKYALGPITNLVNNSGNTSTFVLLSFVVGGKRTPSNMIKVRLAPRPRRLSTVTNARIPRQIGTVADVSDGYAEVKAPTPSVP